MSADIQGIRYPRITREFLHEPTIIQAAAKLGLPLPRRESDHYLFGATYVNKGALTIAALGLLQKGSRRNSSTMTVAVSPELNGSTGQVKSGITSRLHRISEDDQRYRFDVDPLTVVALQETHEYSKVAVEDIAGGQFVVLVREALNAELSAAS